MRKCKKAFSLDHAYWHYSTGWSSRHILMLNGYSGGYRADQGTVFGLSNWAWVAKTQREKSGSSPYLPTTHIKLHPQKDLLSLGSKTLILAVLSGFFSFRDKSFFMLHGKKKKHGNADLLFQCWAHFLSSWMSSKLRVGWCVGGPIASNFDQPCF